MDKPAVICPSCTKSAPLEKVLTAQSNQNVIYGCLYCKYEVKNIRISKG